MRQQSSLKNSNKNPNFNKKMPNLTWAKVVKVHAGGTVDIALHNGGTYQNVQVASWALGSHVGNVYIPSHDLTNPVNDPNGTWDVPWASGNADVYAIVAFLEESSRQPKVIGFINPKASEMRFSTLGIKVERHESGAYHIVLPDGHEEFRFPDGSYFISGSDTQHDMTIENANWNVPTTAIKPMVLHHASGAEISIDVDGNITISGNTITLQGATHTTVID